jgi:hypothetical protein
MAPSRSSARDPLVERIFRAAVAMEFVGHGAFGLLTKAAWLPYFGVFAIPEAWAWRLMPAVGALDVAVGVVALVRPMRAVLLHMALWGLMTAALRPLAGHGVWELLERGYNYAVPLAFLVAAGFPATLGGWLERVDFRPTRARRRMAASVLRWGIALSLIGHGGIALATPQRWTVYLAALGTSPDTLGGLAILTRAAWLEIALGIAVLLTPGKAHAVLVFVCAWKVVTEALRIPAGEPIWEFVERGGAYAAPLLLVLLERAATTEMKVPDRNASSAREEAHA